MSCVNLGLLPLQDGISTRRSSIVVEPGCLSKGLSKEDAPK